jgi:hypothetical protein
MGEPIRLCCLAEESRGGDAVHWELDQPVGLSAMITLSYNHLN